MDKTDREAYFSEPEHRRWRYHHVDGGNKDHPAALLAFTAAWREKHLPPQAYSRSDGTPLLVATYRDRTDGKLYQAPIHVVYEDTFEVMNGEWEVVEVDTLRCYMYRDHHCDCHRKLELAGQVPGMEDEWAVDNDFPCAGVSRFEIVSVCAPGMPGLALYSETASADELERLLLLGQQEEPADAPEEAPAATA